MAIPIALAFLVVLLAVAGFATFASPQWPFPALGVALGALPFAQLPLLPGALIVLLALICWASLATGEWSPPAPSAPVVATVALLLTAVLSLLATGVDGEAVRDLIRWGAVTSVAIPLLAVGTRARATFGRTFVIAASVAAALGVVLLRLDPHGLIVSRLGLGHQDPFGGNLRQVRFADGSTAARLTSVWLDPNVAGLMMTGALILALLLLRGWLRAVCVGVLLLAVLLTLSRAAIGTLAVGGVLLVLGSRLEARVKRRLAGLGALLAAGGLMVPGVLTRLLDSFGSSDIGSSARVDALVDLPGQMSGHWLFGRGWGLPELLDGTVARVANYPANALLLTLYRGGIWMAVAFGAVLVVLLLQGWAMLRRPDFESAAAGAGLLALVLVALQLDFAAVSILPTVMLLAVLLALVRPESPR